MTPDPERLDDLRERIRATQEAAERLISEGVPRQGWASAEEAEETTREVQALAALLQALRELVPPELQEQLREVLRQLLLLVRALVDWWVERLEPGAAESAGPEPGLEDIPITPGS